MDKLLDMQGNKADSDAAVFLKDCLFRYRKLSDGQDVYTLDALHKDRLYFSTPANFNDPYDLLMYVDIFEIFGRIDQSWKNMDNYLKRLAEKEFLKASAFKSLWDNASSRDKIRNDFFELVCCVIEKVKAQTRDYVKIICFAEEYRSMLMWSHYAGDHKGIVLAYDKEDIRQAKCFDKFGNLSANKSYLGKVTYSDKRIDFTDVIESQLLKYELAGEFDRDAIADAPKAKLREFVLHKAKEWEYEREWRLIPRIIDLNAESPLCYMQAVPKAIIIGAQCEEAHRIEVKKIAKRKNITVYESKLDDMSRRYDMDVVRAE